MTHESKNLDSFSNSRLNRWDWQLEDIYKDKNAKSLYFIQLWICFDNSSDAINKETHSTILLQLFQT